MKKVLLMLLALAATLSAQELFTEVHAPLQGQGPNHIFRVLGDKEAGAFSVYGIHVIAPDGQQHMLDQFDAFLPPEAAVDALFVEDVNFDGYADIRLMKYLPGGANVPFFYWLYNPQTQVFEGTKAYEAVLSPRVDSQQKLLISEQRASAASYITEYYRTQGKNLQLTKRVTRDYQSDGSSVEKTFRVTNGQEELLETKNLPPER